MFDDILVQIDSRLVDANKLAIILDTLDEKIDKDNFFLANKVIGYKKGRVNNYVVSLYKDLFYLLENGHQMITLSDIAKLHDDLFSKDVNKSIRKEYTKNFNDLAFKICEFTDNIVVPTEQLYEGDKVGVYYANIESLMAYGIDAKTTRKDLLSYLNAINEYLLVLSKKNIVRNCYYKYKELKDDVANTNEYSVDSVLENLRVYDGYEFALRYQYDNERRKY